MSLPTKLSLLLIFGYPVLNVATVYAIVQVNNWFLLSLLYPVLFGLVIPLLVLLAFWGAILATAKAPRAFLWPAIATLAGLLCGAFHFFIAAIASASV